MQKLRFLLGVVLLAALRAAPDDPSLTPLRSWVVPGEFSERFRILVDLDGDGVNDLLLSGGPEAFGMAGGPWEVYLNRRGALIRVGEILAHPLAIAFEPDPGRIMKEVRDRRYVRIWTYHRSSGSEGALGYFVVRENAVDALKSIEIYPGDGGTSLGNAIYDATFTHSPIPFTMERSVTSADGKVTWTASKGR